MNIKRKCYFLILGILSLLYADLTLFAADNQSKLISKTTYSLGMYGMAYFWQSLPPYGLEWFSQKPELFRTFRIQESVPVKKLIPGELILAGSLIYLAPRNMTSSTKNQEFLSLLQTQSTATALNQFSKWLFGSYRPDYLDREKRYQEILDWISSTPGTTPEEEELLRKWQKIMLDGRRSFWSGHATEISATMTYLSYFNWNYNLIKNKNLNLLTTGGLSALIGLVSASRLIDNRHHPRDVWTGIMCGTLTATLVYYYTHDKWPYASTKHGAEILAAHGLGLAVGFALSDLFFEKP